MRPIRWEGYSRRSYFRQSQTGKWDLYELAFGLSHRTIECRQAGRRSRRALRRRRQEDQGSDKPGGTLRRRTGDVGGYSQYAPPNWNPD
jgi:hypothetical protein